MKHPKKVYIGLKVGDAVPMVYYLTRDKAGRTRLLARGWTYTGHRKWVKRGGTRTYMFYMRTSEDNYQRHMSSVVAPIPGVYTR